MLINNDSPPPLNAFNDMNAFIKSTKLLNHK